MSNEKYMAIAIDQAELAFKAGEFPVGCVIAYDGKIIATGARLNSSRGIVNEVDHAEIVALREFSENSNSIDKEKAVLFCTLEPCLMCYAAILLSGITSIVYAYEDAMGGGTSCDLSSLPSLYAKAKMNITPGVLRDKSLGLFIKFFKNPGNRYWKNSFLEKYTLSQSNPNETERHGKSAGKSQ